jgi:4-amino-4-deoxy-L-arabinose transferase-like glycosyltransferase
MGFIKKYHLPLFFIAWTLLNVIQAAFTVLLNDEAYYWVYSNFLDWGYFDHPPMIALLIRSGYFLIHNELGVRLFIVVLNTLTLIIIYRLLPRKNDSLFYAIAGSIALMQLGGFIAVPDMPLVFFVALFFLYYKKFIETGSWKDTFLLGIVMSLMLYSKYHGVLVILFTVASNISLLKNKKAWVAFLTATILFLPHLLWQYKNQFPSVQYHLFERTAAGFDPLNPLEFIAGQLLLAGPLMGWFFIWCALKYRTKNLYERALQFSMIGIYLFFLATTLRGEAEGNWTVAAIIPLIILAHQYLCDRKNLQQMLLKTLPLSLLFVLAVRVYLISPVKPIKSLNTNEFEQNSSWAQKIHDASGGLPVVFISSYQKAAKYWYYGGIPAFSLNTPFYRRNNYNFWPIEKSLQGKKVYAVSKYDPAVFRDSFQTSAGLLRGKEIDSFYSFSGVRLVAVGELKLTTDNKIAATIKIIDPASAFIGVKGLNIEAFQHEVVLQLFSKENLMGSYELQLQPSTIDSSIVQVTSSHEVKLPPGKYVAKFAISTCLPGYFTVNSTTLKITLP